MFAMFSSLTAALCMDSFTENDVPQEEKVAEPLIELQNTNTQIQEDMSTISQAYKTSLSAWGKAITTYGLGSEKQKENVENEN